MDLGALNGFQSGMDKFTREALMGFIFYPLYVDFIDENDLNLYLCTQMWFDQGKGLDDCLNSDQNRKWWA